MASTDVQWMPATGRHPVNIGSSLGRALKARKGSIAAPKKSNLPDRDFYSFRYNFKPESIDTSKPGSIDVKRGKDSTSVTIERPSIQAGENHVFKGNEHSAKEWECVLIYDEEMGTFTLEKLDSFMGLSYDGRTSSSSSSLPQASASPLPSAPAPAPAPAPPATNSRPKEPARDLDFEKELERDLLGLEDADGELDDGYEEILSKVPVRKEEEEEEEEEEIIIPQPRVPPPAPPPKAKLPITSKISSKPETSSVKESKPKPSKSKGKTKRDHESSGVDDSDLEEVLSFGLPTRQAKRPRPSSPMRLALPNATSGFTSLPPPPRSVAAPPRPNPPSPVAAPESDSDEDWDKVAGIPPASTNQNDTNDGEVEEEIDLDAFGLEMEMELEESEDDILAAAMTPEPESATRTSGPMSLNQYAGGQFSQDEDDSSSSEDSDDD